MRISVRYYTRSGNTKKLALAVAEALNVQAESVEVPLEEKTELVFLGCSYYAFDVDEAVKSFIRENRENIGKLVCFGTSALMSSMQKPVGKLARENGVELSALEFHCRGSFGPLHKGRPNGEDLKRAAAFAKRTAGV